ncbi:MAG: PH domain-containing protein [Clostridia bacterium]
MPEIIYRWKDRKRTLFGLPWSFTIYKLTEEKLFIETGLFNKKEEEIRLYRIMDVTLKRSFSERIWGLGTIHCCSADKSSPEFDIRRIKRAGEVKTLLSDMVEEQRTAKRVTSREFIQAEGDFDDDGGNTL